jgi:hypothetical protein
MASTGKAVRTATVEALAALKQQFEQWRAARRQGEKIPAPLWDAAVGAMAEHSAYRVSRELRLDYMSLKRRAALPGPSTHPRAPRFVELAAPQGVPMPTAQLEPQCVVEMANARGATMRVQLHGGALAGLPALCQAFWGA